MFILCWLKEDGRTIAAAKATSRFGMDSLDMVLEGGNVVAIFMTVRAKWDSSIPWLFTYLKESSKIQLGAKKLKHTSTLHRMGSWCCGSSSRRVSERISTLFILIGVFTWRPWYEDWGVNYDKVLVLSDFFSFFNRWGRVTSPFFCQLSFLDLVAFIFILSKIGDCST